MRKALFISQNFVRILLGLLFIVSAVMKLVSLDSLVIYMFSFKILSFALTELVARFLIAFELALGVMLITKIKYKWVWWTAMAMMIAFTFFLIYAVIFRNDSNCHCFGDIIKVKPLVSIFKNLGIMGIMLFVYGKCERRFCIGWMKDESGGERFNCKMVAEQDVFCTEKSYSKRFKWIFFSICGLLIIVASFVIFPPKAILSKIFSHNDLVATPIFEKALNDSLISLHFTHTKYIEGSDTVTFDVDTNYLTSLKGNQIVAVVSAGCHYCQQSCQLMHDIFDRNNLDDSKFMIWIWGSNYPHCAHFLRKTSCWAHDCYRVSPVLAVDMVYGSFPTFMMVKDGKIVKSFEYNGVYESRVVDFVKSGKY